jgi:hypothetical protein
MLILERDLPARSFPVIFILVGIRVFVSSTLGIVALATRLVSPGAVPKEEPQNRSDQANAEVQIMQRHQTIAPLSSRAMNLPMEGHFHSGVG